MLLHKTRQLRARSRNVQTHHKRIPQERNSYARVFLGPTKRRGGSAGCAQARSRPGYYLCPDTSRPHSLRIASHPRGLSRSPPACDHMARKSARCRGGRGRRTHPGDTRSTVSSKLSRQRSSLWNCARRTGYIKCTPRRCLRHTLFKPHEAANMR